MEDELRIRSHKLSWSGDEIAEMMYKIKGVFETGHVVLGPYTQQFEEEYAAACSRQFGTAMGSDTAAFEALLKIIDVKGSHVLYPALGFPSLLESLKNAGGEPWFIDATLDGHLFATADMVEAAIKDCEKTTGAKPRALILMHTGGLIARDSAEIDEVCKKHGVVVFEDAAHAYYAKLGDRFAGTFGVASAFSLYGTKPMHSMEGGVIVTDDQAIADEAKIYRNYGRVADFGRSVVTKHGYSWRMTEIQAIVGLQNLKGIAANVARRREIMALYDDLTAGHDSWDSLAPRLSWSEAMQPNGYRYIRLLPEGTTTEDRMKMKQWLREAYGVDLPGEVYELPSHLQPVWQEEYPKVSMPVAEDFCARHFSLPVYQSLSDQDCGYIVEAVESALVEHFG